VSAEVLCSSAQALLEKVVGMPARDMESGMVNL
jgi:hypothetical protein